MSNSGYCIGVDLGGTNTAVGLYSLETKSLSRQFSFKTNAPRSAESIANDIVDVAKKLSSQEGIDYSSLKWVGIAAPGIVKDGVVLNSINLSWQNVKLGDILSDASGMPAYVANDANAAAYAEALCGSGEGARSLVAITLGTGVGGGIVFDGKIWEGFNGCAAELGHTILVPDGRVCACGKHGCLEAYCSITAFVKETRRVMKLNPDSAMWRVADGSLDRANGRTAFIAKREGDKAATLVVDEFTDFLAIGVANIINTLQPDVVCIGGGLSREGENLVAPLRERVLRGTFGTEGKRTKVVAATYRNDAGIIGAALLGLQKGD